MARVVLGVIVALLMIYCVVDVAMSQKLKVRVMPRWLWATTVICIPLVGSLAWLLAGRPKTNEKPQVGPRAPDDDPDFLRKL